MRQRSSEKSCTITGNNSCYMRSQPEIGVKNRNDCRHGVHAFACLISPGEKHSDCAQQRRHRNSDLVFRNKFKEKTDSNSNKGCEENGFIKGGHWRSAPYNASEGNTDTQQNERGQYGEGQNACESAVRRTGPGKSHQEKRQYKKPLAEKKIAGIIKMHFKGNMFVLTSRLCLLGNAAVQTFHGTHKGARIRRRICQCFKKRNITADRICRHANKGGFQILCRSHPLFFLPGKRRKQGKHLPRCTDLIQTLEHCLKIFGDFPFSFLVHIGGLIDQAF